MTSDPEIGLSFLTRELLPPPLSALVTRAFNLHRQFDQTVWGDRPSFHNIFHLVANCQAGFLLVKAAQDGTDPLHLADDLANWNSNHPGSCLSFSDLAAITVLSFAFHDLGDIASLGQGGDQIIFLPSYGINTELQSQQISSWLLSRSGLSTSLVQSYSPLLFHLIGQTTFNYYHPRSLFDTFVKVCDQASNEIFNRCPSYIQGTWQETFARDPYASICLETSYNFASHRVAALDLDPFQQSQLWSIWQGQPHHIPGLETFPSQPLASLLTALPPRLSDQQVLQFLLSHPQLLVH
jgi:hypothetical protein